MILTHENKIDFKKAKQCRICSGQFGKKENKKKVRDHCHFIGKYRGAAHYLCNLQFKKPKFTPVVFHNLANYDSHLFIKNLGKTEGNIKCIPNNGEKYISFSKYVVVGSFKNKKGENKEIKHEIRFIDSFKFMSSSLDKLISNLSKDKLKQNEKGFKDMNCCCKIDLISRKGIYVPKKEAFYSKLNDSDISDEDYEHGKKTGMCLK